MNPRWGVGIGLRYADIPFAAQERSVTDIVPLLFYEGERFFLNGIEGGAKLLGGEWWRLDAYMRYRFFDFPRRLQNENREDGWDAGLELRHAFYRNWEMRWGLFSDNAGGAYLDAGAQTRYGGDHASLRPYVGLRIKSADYNDRYFGLGVGQLGAGADVHARVEGLYHLWSNLYLIGRFGGYYLDADARRSASVRDDMAWELFAGIGVFERPRTATRGPRRGSYWRLAHGWATYSNLGDTVRGDIEADPDDNRLTSLFYGHPMADELFGLPLRFYLTAGAVMHHPSRVQSRSAEYVIAFKAYYTASWPVRMRFGVAEGLSYASQVPHVERTKLEARGYRPNKLLNYLGFSIDANLGDLLDLTSARKLWVGYGIHHRSGIFGTGSQFGRVSGGSNYNTLYVQWEY